MHTYVYKYINIFHLNCKRDKMRPTGRHSVNNIRFDSVKPAADFFHSPRLDESRTCGSAPFSKHFSLCKKKKKAPKLIEQLIVFVLEKKNRSFVMSQSLQSASSSAPQPSDAISPRRSVFLAAGCKHTVQPPLLTSHNVKILPQTSPGGCRI